MNFIKLGRIFDNAVRPVCKEMPDEITNIILDYANKEEVFEDKPHPLYIVRGFVQYKVCHYVGSQMTEEQLKGDFKKAYYCECCGRIFKSKVWDHIQTKTHKKNIGKERDLGDLESKVKKYFTRMIKNKSNSYIPWWRGQANPQLEKNVFSVVNVGLIKLETQLFGKLGQYYEIKF